jgi:inner membrane protein
VPSSIAHASVAVVASPLLPARWRTPRVVGWTAVAAAAPDLDAIGRPFGYGDLAILGGHRGFTHSIAAAALMAALAFLLVAHGAERRDRMYVALIVAGVVASHGLLDAFTTYGEGVAFFAPFSLHRWKANWRPFGGLWSEVIALWLPAALIYALWLKRDFSETRAAVLKRYHSPDGAELP